MSPTPVTQLPISQHLPCTVLVVDDHESTREMLGVALGIHGFEVRLAENGAEAMDMLSANSCQVVLTDFWMPEMNGVELLHAIRANTRLTDMPVILMTAAQGKPPQGAAGADAFLRKPFDSATLLRVLSEVRCRPRH
jgi:CheY-like chemotaxis protein